MSSEMTKKECLITAYGIKNIGMVELAYIPNTYQWEMIATTKYGNMLGKRVMKDLPTEEQIRKFWMEQYELGGDGD
jgi:hypothetical protein